MTDIPIPPWPDDLELPVVPPSLLRTDKGYARYGDTYYVTDIDLSSPEPPNWTEIPADDVPLEVRLALNSTPPPHYPAHTTLSDAPPSE
jgi:hypothetical protein